MEFNDKIITVIIAGVVSFIGVLVNVYLNKKSNKQLLNKIRIEHSLKENEERKHKLEDFLFRVKKFQYTLLDIIEEIETKEDDLDLNAIKNNFRTDYSEVREEWMKITFLIHNAAMKGSIELGQKMHDGISGNYGSIRLYLKKMDKSDEDFKEKTQILKNKICAFNEEFDDLIQLIIREIKINQEKIFKPTSNKA